MRLNWVVPLQILGFFIACIAFAVGLAFVFMWHAWLGWTLSALALIAFLIYVGFDSAKW